MSSVTHPFSATPALAGRTAEFWSRRHLLLALTKLELRDRYAGQMLGLGWTLLHPLIQVGVYTFVFAVVFRVRLGEGQSSFEYVTYLLSALVPWLCVQECLLKSTTSITSNTSLVKQVVFPLELLPAKGVLASFVTQVITTGILLGVVGWSGRCSAMLLLIPLLWTLQLVLLLGAASLLGAVGAYFRDLKEFVQIACMVGMYCCPICYAPESVPSVVRPLLYLNPASYLAWCYQDAFFYGRFEHPWAWGMFALLAGAAFGAGARVFKKLKPYFGSVL